MATLYQRDNCYYINYCVNGKRVRKAVGTNKQEAKLLLKELDFKLSKGIVRPDRPEIPSDYFFRKYLENCQMRLSKGTFIRYRNALKHVQRYLTVEQPVQFISQLTKGMLQDYILYRQKSKSKPKGKTVNIELTVIRAALNWAKDKDWLEKSPADKLKMAKMNDSRKGASILDDEIKALLRGCETLRNGFWFRDVLTTFLNTGMRRGELVNLTWNDIDWEQNFIKIQEKPFWSPKTYERNIPINMTVEEILQKYMGKSKSMFVFNRKGQKIKDNALRKKLITLSNRVGLSHITRIHDFRHTFASNLLMKGVDIPTVQALLGHKSWNTTIIYSHQTKEHTQMAVERLV